MCIFQSEQVITLRLWLKNILTDLSRQISIRWIIMWGAILGRYICQNQPTLLSWDCLASIWNDLPQEFTDKATLWYFDFVLLQLVDTLNTQFKYWDGSWHSLMKRLKCWWKSSAKFDSLLSKTYWIFRSWLHVHFKTWKPSWRCQTRAT